jgi:hypothetical protein
MAHFAKLDENNQVLEVHVVNNEVLLDSNNTEREELGVAFLIALSGGHPYWKQTSYNASFRKNYAGPGFTYNSSKDAFVPPQPYPSWALDESTLQWMSPIPHPVDGNRYIWNEDTMTWDLYNP